MRKRQEGGTPGPCTTDKLTKTFIYKCRLQKAQVRLTGVGQTITVEGKGQRGQCEARQGNQGKDYVHLLVVFIFSTHERDWAFVQRWNNINVPLCVKKDLHTVNNVVLNWQLGHIWVLRRWFSRAVCERPHGFVIIAVSPHWSEVVKSTCYYGLGPESVKTCWASGLCSAQLWTDIKS